MTNTPNSDFYQTSRGKRALEGLAAITPDDAKSAVLATVPAFRDVRKVEYLVLRAVAFNHWEAMQVMDITGETYNKWLSEDEDFKHWATGPAFKTLAKQVAEQVLKTRFLRNVFLVLHIDNEVLTKRAFEPEEMTADERKEAVEALKRYSAPNIAAMVKVLAGEDGTEGPQGRNEVVLKIQLNDDDVQDQNANRAAARMLLSQFTRFSGGSAIEGEVLSSQ